MTPGGAPVVVGTATLAGAPRVNIVMWDNTGWSKLWDGGVVRFSWSLDVFLVRYK